MLRHVTAKQNWLNCFVVNQTDFKYSNDSDSEFVTKKAKSGDDFDCADNVALKNFKQGSRSEDYFYQV